MTVGGRASVGQARVEGIGRAGTSRGLWRVAGVHLQPLPGSERVELALVLRGRPVLARLGTAALALRRCDLAGRTVLEWRRERMGWTALEHRDAFQKRI